MVTYTAIKNPYDGLCYQTALLYDEDAPLPGETLRYALKSKGEFGRCISGVMERVGNGPYGDEACNNGADCRP